MAGDLFLLSLLTYRLTCQHSVHKEGIMLTEREAKYPSSAQVHVRYNLVSILQCLDTRTAFERHAVNRIIPSNISMNL
jgi:hypothetical protein